jgi:GDSL-like Lipase/Acylhydrolase
MAVFLFFFYVLLLVSPMALGEIDFNYPAVFNFGDSNSDTGGRVASGLESISPPYGVTFFGRPSGRFCDGRLIIDFLSKPFSLFEFCSCVVLHCDAIRRTITVTFFLNLHLYPFKKKIEVT